MQNSNQWSKEGLRKKSWSPNQHPKHFDHFSIVFCKLLHMITSNYYLHGQSLCGGYHIGFTLSHELPIKLHGFRRTTGQPALVQNNTVNTIIGHTQIDPQFRRLKAFFSHVWDDRREDKISMGLSLLFILTPPLFLLLASISSM